MEDPAQVHEDTVLWDGKQTLYHYRTTPLLKANVKPPAAGTQPVKRYSVVMKMSTSPSDMVQRRAGLGQPLDGYFAGEKEMTPTLLRTAQLTLMKDTEPVGGVNCYVINAVAPFGKYKVWIDPEHGYNAARVTIEQSGHDLYIGKPLPRPSLGGRVIIGGDESTEFTKFEQVEGHWLPVACEGSGTCRFEGGKTSGATITYQRSKISLHPDFAALHAFTLDAPNGTQVATDMPGIQMVWKDGKAVPVIAKGSTKVD